MALSLHMHPLASFCHKVLIALYEAGTPFTALMIDHADPATIARLMELWPVGKMPVLQDSARNQVVPETTIIIEYLDRHYPGRRRLLPANEDARLDARLWDRFFDLYVHVPMQKIVLDRLRSATEKDPAGLAEARAMIATAYDMIERRMTDRTWAAGDDFSIADCAAAPALFYASIVVPIPGSHPQVADYFERLLARPSFARVLDEARPYFHLYPFKDDMPARFLRA